MNIWEILGIPPTTDMIEIKRAYGQMAKKWHPEEHPEEFKRLRNAYQSALQWARRGQGETETGEARGRRPSGERSETSGGPSPEERTGTDERPPGERTGTNERTSPEKKAGAGERRFSAETTGEKAATGSWEEREEEPQPHFSYDNVSSFYQKELEDRFFEEFYRIVWNPYLQNKKAIWNYFLFQPEYEDLFCHNGFRQKLLEEICFVPGWHRDTLDYFERWEDLWREPDRDKREEGSQRMADSGQWRRKKWRSKFTCFMPEHVVSPEQRREHYEILQIMKDRGLDEGLFSVSSAGFYLQCYGAFLKEHETWFERQRSLSCRKRGKKWLLSGAVALALTILLLLALVVYPLVDAAKEEKLREQRKQEERILQEEREKREQEEWQRELEERFDTMQEQYRDWLEQESAEP